MNHPQVFVKPQAWASVIALAASRGGAGVGAASGEIATKQIGG